MIELLMWFENWVCLSCFEDVKVDLHSNFIWYKMVQEGSR